MKRPKVRSLPRPHNWDIHNQPGAADGVQPLPLEKIEEIARETRVLAQEINAEIAAEMIRMEQEAKEYAKRKTREKRERFYQQHPLLVFFKPFTEAFYLKEAHGEPAGDNK